VTLHRKLLRFELVTANIFDDVLRSHQFLNRCAANTVGIRARPDLAQKIDSFAQVIVYIYTFWLSVAFGIMDKHRTLFLHGMGVTDNSGR
jgi:hypothetical protein